MPEFGAVWARLTPGLRLPAPSWSELAVTLAAVLAAVWIRPLWALARLGVTLAHELGHAIVGLLLGRRFVGFVLRGDMSGHAVTQGRSRGVGRVLTTWAGYPAPALLALGMIWGSRAGFAAALLGALLLILGVALFKARSLLTAVSTVALLAGGGALWWFRDDRLQRQVLYGVGLVLLVGGWRHLGAVVRAGGAKDDPGALGELTGIPSGVWNLTFAAALGACTWFGVRILLGFEG